MISRGDDSPTDIRDQLHRDHESALAELEALRAEGDAARCRENLRRLRRAWMVHALAEETVVYRALEGVEGASRADERFVEHELVEALFDKLTRTPPGSLEWRARLSVARELIMRHIETEHEQLFAQLAERYDAAALAGLAGQFRSACEKLSMLEDAKAA